MVWSKNTRVQMYVLGKCRCDHFLELKLHKCKYVLILTRNTMKIKIISFPNRQNMSFLVSDVLTNVWESNLSWTAGRVSHQTTDSFQNGCIIRQDSKCRKKWQDLCKNKNTQNRCTYKCFVWVSISRPGELPSETGIDPVSLLSARSSQ